MKSVLTAIALAAVGALGACAPAARTSTHYLSIRNDTAQEVYVTYSGGVHSVSATIAPNSRVVMRGAPFRADVFASEGTPGDYYSDYVHRGAGRLGTFDSLDARILPSGDQVRVVEEGKAIQAVGIGFDNKEEVAK